MVQRYSRRAAMLTAATPTSARGLRTFRVMCEDCLQVTLRCPDVASALAEAEHYRQPNDDLAVWEGSRIVGVLTDAPAPAGYYADGGIPKSIEYHPHGPRPASTLGAVVLPEDGGPGFFLLRDHRPLAQLEAIRRFIDHNDRSPETMALVSAGLCAPV